MSIKRKHLLLIAIAVFIIGVALFFSRSQNGYTEAANLRQELSLSGQELMRHEAKRKLTRSREVSVDGSKSLLSKLAIVDGELGMIRLSAQELESVLQYFPEIERVDSPELELSSEQLNFAQNLIGVFSREQLQDVLHLINLGTTTTSGSGSISSTDNQMEVTATISPIHVNDELVDVEFTLTEPLGDDISPEIRRSRGSMPILPGWIVLLRSAGRDPSGVLIVVGADC